MRWGIAFSVPATHKNYLWALPPPSQTEIMQRSDGKKVIKILYHFLYTPQSKKEWQRVAGIKVQIANKVKGIEFQEYEPLAIDGKFYTISELGKYFKEFVKFPAPFFDGTPQAILTRHAKRLYYEGILHIEQLIFVSMWIKEIAPKGESGRRKKDEGIRQVIKRANSAYQFALDHLDEWPIRLNVKERHEVLRKSAIKSARIRSKKSESKRERAKNLRDEGETLSKISSLLGVSKRTIQRWLKQ